MVIEDLETIKKGANHFSIQRIVFPAEAKMLIFWSLHDVLSKFNTGSLPLRGILPVKTYKHHIFAPTAGARSAIFHKLCMVIELVEAIRKCHPFFDPAHSFSYRVHGKIGHN